MAQTRPNNAKTYCQWYGGIDPNVNDLTVQHYGWSWHNLGMPDSGFTIEHDGCVLCAIAMLAQMNPLEVNQKGIAWT